MSDLVVKKLAHDGQEVEILGPTYEPGKPLQPDNWRLKIGTDRKDVMRYLKTSLRYWHGTESYGSEKRKSPA